MSEIRPEINVSPATLTLRPGGVVILGVGSDFLTTAQRDTIRTHLTELLPEARGVIVIERTLQSFAFVINVEPYHLPGA